MKRFLNRRRFLGEASCAAVGSTALFSTLLNLRLAGTAAAADLDDGSDYKALVCLFLAGGNDSFNMLMPREQDSYAVYQDTRDEIAHPRDVILPVTSARQAAGEFGLHPNLPKLQSHYNAGNVAFVANVGTLLRPITKADFSNRSSRPSGLFSHSDQQMQWQTAMPQIRGSKPGGWGGRTADLLHTLNRDHTVSMNISFRGVNTFQIGSESFPFVAGLDGNPTLHLMNDPVTAVAARSILEREYKHLFLQGYAQKGKGAMQAAELYNTAIANREITTAFPETDLGGQMKALLRTLAGHSLLGVRRQTFFVHRGGWDHHNEVLNSQTELFTEVDAVLDAFWKGLVEIGMEDKVVLFTASDFGRTLATNGIGSDHGWGGNHFLMGGPVKGGEIYGEYPSLDLGGDHDVGRGRLLPTTSTDAYFGELASWFGVAPGELETVLPNCRNFYDPVAAPFPLGVLG